MKNYHHILIASDLTDASKLATERAVEMAKLCSAKISMIHVIEPIPAYGYLGVTEIESPHIDHAKDEMKKIADKFGISEANLHIEVGPTKVEIHEMAEKLKADLIVTGSHGRHGIGLLLGSTSNAVLHGAHCDVLVVRAKKH